jgi:CheY-like chemotaxis protein
MNEFSKPQVLLVDDVPGNLKVLCNLLEPEGYDVLVASRGKDALQTAAQVLPDLILLDVVMPEMDGFEVCRNLKAEGNYSGIQRIVKK